MKALRAFSSIVFLALCCGSLFAQSALPPTDVISVQPIIHVNNSLIDNLETQRYISITLGDEMRGFSMVGGFVVSLRRR